LNIILFVIRSVENSSNSFEIENKDIRRKFNFIILYDKKISYNVNIQEYETRVKKHTNIELSPTGYDYWTIKEIHEQPESVLRAINNGGRLLTDSTVRLGGLDSNKSNLLDIDHMILLGCEQDF
jgi:glucosamine 6-phosphate synthetase-like amidotransferase/phosphosugar isomerase protein